MTDAIQRLLERLQTGWRPVSQEIDRKIPQRTLVDWSMVPGSAAMSAMKLWGTPLEEIGDVDNTWLTEEVLWIDPAFSWALCADGMFWLQAEVVTRRHGVMGGSACFDGTRIPVRLLCSYVLASPAVDEMCRDYPSLAPGAAQTAILRAFRLLERAAPVVGPRDPLEALLDDLPPPAAEAVVEGGDLYRLQRDDESDDDYLARCEALGCDGDGYIRLPRWRREGS